MRYLIELGVVRSVRRNARYLIELRAVRSLFEVIRGIDRVQSCEEFVSRMARYPIELGVVRRMLGEMKVSD